MTMTGMIVATHGQFAEGLMSAVELIAGEQPGVEAINFVDGMGTDDLRLAMLDKLEAMEAEDILILADLAGGSPYNVASLLSTELTNKNIRVLSGVNLPMVMETALTKDMMPLDDLVQAGINAGKDGIRPFEMAAPVNVVPDDDGIWGVIWDD